MRKKFGMAGRMSKSGVYGLRRVSSRGPINIAKRTFKRRKICNQTSLYLRLQVIKLSLNYESRPHFLLPLQEGGRGTLSIQRVRKAFFKYYNNPDYLRKEGHRQTEKNVWPLPTDRQTI